MQNVQLVDDLCTQITQKRRTNVNEIFHKSRNGNAKFSYYYTISTATVDGQRATDVGRIESCLETSWLSSSLTVSTKHTHTDTRTQREINIIERGKRALSTEQ